MVFERNKKKLHRVAASKQADWEGLGSSELNPWQRTAISTHGLLTIGNVLTFLGFTLVIMGIILTAREHFVSGTFLIGCGRLLDYADGIAADMTRTKSRLGASFDEVADAIGLGTLLVVLLSEHILPLAVVLIIGLPKAINAVSWVIAKARHIRVNTTAQSKVATFIIWCGIGAYLFHIPAYSPANNILELFAWAFILLGAALTVPSSVVYLRSSLAK